MISSPVEKHIIQICTSSVSLLASSTIAIMILTSPTGLTTPYKRIIFGLSISDILQSLALITGPFAPPTGTPQSPWAVGNAATCDANGFIMTTGSCAVPMYTCALCIFYMCKLVYRMSDKNFARRLEVFLHTGIILFQICVGIASLITQTFNASPLAGFCYFAALPQECNYAGSHNYGTCVRGEHSFTFIYISTIAAPTLCLVGIFLCMSVILQHAHRKAKQFRAEYGQSAAVAVGNNGLMLPQQQGRESYGEYLVRLYLREAVIQSCLYVLGFVAIYIVPLVTCLKLLIDIHGMDNNSTIPLLLALLFPLGGLYNILVYTRPNVLALRRRETTISWFQAFFWVIRAGGEVPSSRVVHGRSSCISRCCACFQKEKASHPHQQSSQKNANAAVAQAVSTDDRRSQVNQASVEGMLDGSLYLHDFVCNNESQPTTGDDVQHEPERTNTVISRSRYQVTFQPSGKERKSGNIMERIHTSSGDLSNVRQNRPILLIRTQLGDMSNISSLNDDPFDEEGTKSDLQP